MTPITPTTIYTQRTLNLRDLRTAAVTAAMLFSWAFAAHSLSVAETPDSRMERVMLAACKLPDSDGAATIYARVDGLIFCWRME